MFLRRHPKWTNALGEIHLHRVPTGWTVLASRIKFYIRYDPGIGHGLCGSECDSLQILN